jgi:galactokinase
VTVTAFAPGRVNLIGEHTDYNGGLALPFAIERGVTVRAGAGGGSPSGSAHVREVMLELRVPDARVEIDSGLPQGAGLSSSAALTLATALALGADAEDPIALARVAQRVERSLGADTGLLDQLAILLGRPGHAVRIDFRSLEWRHVPLDLGDWTLATIDSGAAHSNAESGYNERRAECRAAAAELGVESLRDAHRDDVLDLREPLGRRLRHVLSENDRVDAVVDALESGDLSSVGELIDASHESLRDLYDASVPEVEDTVARAKAAGAAGARMMGGGFGGVVLALFPPDARPPADALVVRPSAGARVL